MTARLVVLGLVVLAVALAAWVHRRRSWRDGARGSHGLPPVPGHLLGAGTTWVIFTTPLCASCEAVEEHLRRAFPQDRVVKVDATVDTELAERYHVRRAPTVLRVDGRGTVTERLVGPDAVRRSTVVA